MGRSVMTHANAEATLYFAMPGIDDLRDDAIARAREDGDDDEMEWLEGLSAEAFFDDSTLLFEDFVEGLQYALTARYDGFEEADSWAGREVHVIAQNEMVEVSVSEYCDLISVCIAPRDDEGHFDDMDGLRESWARRMAPHIARVISEASILQPLQRLGAFSNGEVVFTAA